MKRIAILSSSVRTGRLSHRVALYLQHYLTANELAETEILDLKAYDFPLFEERFAFLPNPSGKVIDFTERLVAADALIIVTPVYNASFPAALKNVIDLYLQEWAPPTGGGRFGHLGQSAGNRDGTATPGFAAETRGVGRTDAVHGDFGRGDFRRKRDGRFSRSDRETAAPDDRRATLG